ncbi:MAG: KdsC family phosphatase [Gammaproteobacteria bacterium]
MGNDIDDKAGRIRLLVLDVDGVLTDGKLYFTADGHELKAFDVKDGHGMVMLQTSGVKIAVITGRESALVTHRMSELGIEHVLQGRKNKARALDELLDELGLEAEQAAFVGDDVVDLPAMRRAGVAIAVADAHKQVIQLADWVTVNNGGNGAAREVCEAIMTAQGTLGEAMKCYA